MNAASRIVSIHMENFAGFQDTEGSRTYGPFTSFTMLLGGTGAGKSSTIRAIAFVLGDEPGHKTSETGRVALTLGRDRREKVFERSRSQENDSYFVNKKSVSQLVYLDQLRREGVTLEMRKHMVHCNGTYADLVVREDSEISAILEEQLNSSELKRQYNTLSRKLESYMESEDSDDSDAESEKPEAEKPEEQKKLEKEFEEMIYNCPNVSLSMVPTDKDEPYLGLTFVCLPFHHGATVIPVEQLSGGEKKMASVAFLLALNLVKRSPFIVIDELDKALHKDSCLKLGPALQQLGADIQIVAACNDKHMRRFASKQILIKLEDD